MRGHAARMTNVHARCEATRRSRGGGSPSRAPEPRRAQLPRHSYRTNMQPNKGPARDRDARDRDARDSDARDQPKNKPSLKRFVIEIDMNFKGTIVVDINITTSKISYRIDVHFVSDVLRSVT